MADRALSGLVVVDLSLGIAGGYCTKLLADQGAEVIKVEPPEGDPTRHLGPFPDGTPDPERSALFLHLHTGKKSVTLDVTTPAGAATVRRLLARADVLVESFLPGTLARHGLAYDDLAEQYPDLVYCSITPYGQTGPWRDYRGNGFTAWATGGLAYVTGNPDREPLANGADPAEYFAGVNAALGILAALAYRDAHGGGQHVDVSLMEAVAANLEYTTALYSMQGAIRRRWYSRHVFRYPSDIFPCRDGYVAVIYGRTGLQQLAVLLDRPELLEDPLFLSYAERVKRWRELDAILEPYLRSHTAREIVEAAQDLHEPFALVLDVPGLLADPHLRERRYFQELTHPRAGKLRYPGPPYRMSETPWETGRAPLLGEHNDELPPTDQTAG
ncbi:MAG TPA: CoA transferase [Dehalococcoidia bacterium]